MVHSKAFIINDLKKRIKLCNDWSSKIKDLHFRLHNNSGEMFMEIDEKFAVQFEVLKQRKEVLYAEVDDYVMKETKNLCQKSSEIQDNIAKFEELLSSADSIEDDKMFRSLYEDVIDESKSCEEMETCGWEASFYADCKPLEDAINDYGMISVERVGGMPDVKEKPDLMEGLDDWLSVGSANSDETVPEREDPPLDHSPNESDDLLETPENKLQDLMGSDVERKVCEMKGSCNCIGFCEETLLPLKNVESTYSTKEDLKKWLIDGHKVMPMSSSLPARLEQIVDNKVFAQFESLKLCDDQKDFGSAKETVEKLDFKMQALRGMLESWQGLKINDRCYSEEIDSGQFVTAGVFAAWDNICRKPLSAWLKSKPLPNVSKGDDWIIKNATVEELDDICSVSQQRARDAVLNGWDDICRKPLHAWLKVKPIRDVATVCDQALKVAAVEELNDACSEREQPAGNAVFGVWDNICKKPLSAWLRSKPQRNLSASSNPAFQGASVKELDDACSEGEQPARDVVSNKWDDICRKPLSSWLKSKPQKNASTAFKSTTVKELDDLRSVSLQYWLKKDQMIDIEDLGWEAKTCNSSVQILCEAICKEPLEHWLKQNNSDSAMEIDAPTSSASVSVFKVFDKIQKSPLHCWLKRKQPAKVGQIIAPKSPRSFPESLEDHFAPASVKELNNIIASPLSKWLKSNHHDHAESAHPIFSLESQNLRKRSSPSIHVFGRKKMLRPDLNQWLKKPVDSSPRSQKIDLEKWLVN